MKIFPHLQFNRLVTTFLFLLFGILVFANPVYAGSKKIFEQCDSTKTFDDCDTGLRCINSGYDWGFVNKSVCWPQRDYQKCGEAGASVVTIHNAKDLSKFTFDCVSSKYVPNDSTTKSDCSQSADCQAGGSGSVDKQCFWLNIIGTGTSAKSSNKDPFSVARCISVGDVPSIVRDPLNSKTTTGGSNCAKTNAACATGKICVDNPYTPGTQTGERYVCYDEKKIGTVDSCLGKNVGDTCGKNATGVPLTCLIVAGKSGWDSGFDACGVCADSGFTGDACQQLLKDKSCQSGVKCVDVTGLPFGPSAPSSKTCKTNIDCLDPLDKFCIYNPVTKLNQCFRQITAGSVMPTGVYTPLIPMPTTDACAEIGKAGCEKDKPSVCSKYLPDSGKELKVCINSAALETGAANPVFPKADVAAERNERFAPILEIPIPGLSFTEKIIGRNALGGRIFSVPFLAQYLQAVYKYSLGLGILVAVVTIMIAGILWMFSLGDQGRIGNAKKMMINSALGLVILFGAYTILYTINPDLAKLKSLQIFAPKQSTLDLSELNDSTKWAASDPSQVDYSGAPKEMSYTGFDDMFQKFSNCGGVDWRVFKTLAWHESRFNPGAKNKGSTALGLFQILNGTAKGICDGKTFTNGGWNQYCETPGRTHPAVNTAIISRLFVTGRNIIKKKCSSADPWSQFYMILVNNGRGPGALSKRIDAEGCDVHKWADLSADGQKTAGIIAGLGATSIAVDSDEAKCPLTNGSKPDQFPLK